jgi:hypothetical protein
MRTHRISLRMRQVTEAAAVARFHPADGRGARSDWRMRWLPPSVPAAHGQAYPNAGLPHRRSRPKQRAARRHAGCSVAGWGDGGTEAFVAGGIATAPRPTGKSWGGTSEASTADADVAPGSASCAGSARRRSVVRSGRERRASHFLEDPARGPMAQQVLSIDSTAFPEGNSVGATTGGGLSTLREREAVCDHGTSVGIGGSPTGEPRKS